MRHRMSAVLAGAWIVLAAGYAMSACGGSSTEETPACDPLTDPTCPPAGDDSSLGYPWGTQPDGAPWPDGSVLLPDGGVLLPDGAVVPGPTPAGDGSVTLPDGGALPDGSEVLPDGAIVLPDGAIIGGCTAGGTQCTNCIDDDKDGKIDWMDPECTGPLDNDEATYATGIPGDNKDPCRQDCFFDGNSGAGDDKCDWNLKCMAWSKVPKCEYDAAMAKDPKRCPPLSDACKKFCMPLTPKGCDCFGCCDIYDSTGAVHTVYLSPTCSTAVLSDPTKCPTCTKTTDCGTPCGKCDWCLGKTSLPPECYPPPPEPPPPTDGGTDSTTDTAPPPPPPPGTCPTGVTKCDVSTPCPAGYYCLTGCCIKAPA